MKKNTFKLGELFSGPGGIACGAHNAKVRGSEISIEHGWSTDYDKDTCTTYLNNIPKTSKRSVICEDIRKLDLEKLAAVSNIDALAFGFPCNDFSMVGEQKGINGTFGPLYSYCINALTRFKPKWFVAENVGGLKNANEGKTFDLILNEMHRAGYKVYPHLYKFENYGVPQARHRIIIVGIRDDLDFEFKVPSIKPYINKTRTSSDAIENPAIAEGAHNHDYTNQSKSVVERLKHIKPGQNAFTAEIPADLQLNVKGAKISQIYKRLDPQKPAYTVTGSGGGGTHMYHWKENRALTNRERARLQTFPDDFIFHGSKESVRKQIGMAVPCDGAKVVFEAIIKTFASIDYEYDDFSYPVLVGNREAQQKLAI